MHIIFFSLVILAQKVNLSLQTIDHDTQNIKCHLYLSGTHLFTSFNVTFYQCTNNFYLLDYFKKQCLCECIIYIYI